MLITVIVCVRNGENYLKEAIDSIIAQDYCHKEIIVVDDGSTDQTKAILSSYQNQLRVISQPPYGLAAARNAGTKASRGDLISFLDHDDLWPSYKLTEQMRLYDPKTDPLVFGYVKQFICNRLNEEEKQKLKVDLTEMPGYASGTILMSKTRCNEVGFFDPQLQVGEFMDWYMRAKEKNIPMLMHPEVLLFRRVHLSNMGRRKDEFNKKDYLCLLKAALTRRRNAQLLCH